MTRLRPRALLAAALALSACASNEGAGADDRRAFVQLMKRTTLTELEKARPETRDLVAQAAGWAVVGDAGAAAFGARPGVGFGVAHENGSGVESYLRVKRPVPEVGYEPSRLVLVFVDAKRFREFVGHGGTFDGPPPADIDVYQFFADGLAVEPDVLGANFYRDPDLNDR